MRIISFRMQQFGTYRGTKLTLLQVYNSRVEVEALLTMQPIRFRSREAVEHMLLREESVTKLLEELAFPKPKLEAR
jgi:hypothetical protein